LRCIEQFPNLRATAAVEQPGNPAIGQDAGFVAGTTTLGFSVTDAPPPAGAADVLIDFTYHSVVPLNARLAAERGQALVVGTTGLAEDEAKAIRAASSFIPIVMSPNMSLGVNLLFALVEKAAAALGPNYDIEIVEMHHRHKKDAPSGTALRLAEKAADGRKVSLSEVACYGRSGITGERPVGQIAIHALRGGDVVGDHTVCFAAEGERIELGHRASSRDAFARGALRAAEWVHGRPPGLYDMMDVLGL
jgi:4-hydroxy-tetrahydrodipicolinate reductase